MIDLRKSSPPLLRIHENSVYLLKFSSLQHGSSLVYRDLPEIPCVYFCLSPNNYPVYIGESQNLQRRFINHDKKGHCKGVNATKLAWIVDRENNGYIRRRVEAFFINQYIPKFNYQIWNGLKDLPLVKLYERYKVNDGSDRYPLSFVKAVSSPSNNFSRCYSYFYSVGHPIDLARFNSKIFTAAKESLEANFEIQFEYT